MRFARNMAALDKEGAIREMVQSLVDAKRRQCGRVREHCQSDFEA